MKPAETRVGKPVLKISVICVLIADKTIKVSDQKLIKTIRTLSLITEVQTKRWVGFVIACPPAEGTTRNLKR